MRSYYQNFCMLVFCTALCLGMSSIGFCQSAGGWKVEAPPNSVSLISVGQGLLPNALKFTFKNVSGKTIIILEVSDLHGHQIGLDGFLAGRGAVAPGATTSVYFGLQELSAGGQTAKQVRVDAIFYGDGSGFGLGSWKAHIEDRMLGAALETRRDAELLSASPDSSISGLDEVAAQIRSQLQNTPAAAQSLRGITLPGISQTLIKSHLAHPNFYIAAGANGAQGWILNGIRLAKSNDARAMAGPAMVRQRELKKRAHALSDLAKKTSSLSEWQVQYLKKVFQGAGGQGQ